MTMVERATQPVKGVESGIPNPIHVVVSVSSVLYMCVIVETPLIQKSIAIQKNRPHIR
jgi:hypothetical protein